MAAEVPCPRAQRGVRRDDAPSPSLLCGRGRPQRFAARAVPRQGREATSAPDQDAVTSCSFGGVDLPGAGGGRKGLYAAGAVLGTLIALVGAQLYRIDHIRCSNWPPLGIGLSYAPAYVLALVLLTSGWLGLASLCGETPLWGAAPPRLLPRGQRPTLLFVLLVGGACNLLATFIPPFLADDGLAYAAIGRAMQVYHKDMFMPLGQSLPVDDPFRAAISMNYGWLEVGSAYAPGFNWLACLISRLAGDDLALNLRLFQLSSMVAALLAAVIAGRAAFFYALQQSAATGTPASEARQRAAREAGNRATALVLLCPLTIIEASNSAHNDSFLMLSVALFALCVVKGRRLLALLALGGALLVKASGLLLVGLYGVHLLAASLQFRLPALRRRHLVGALAVAIPCTLLLVWELFPFLLRYSSTTARLLGSPNDEYPYCTRSIECLPRGFLHMVLGMRTASWLVGLAFRALAGAFLLYMALRSERGVRHLRWAASFIFFYYLFLHGYSHPWYVLSLLPLLPYAERRFVPAMLALPIANLLHYTLDFPYNCDHTPLMVGLTETIQGLTVLVPSTVLVLRSRRAAATAAG